jgi:hypothetical protein
MPRSRARIVAHISVIRPPLPATVVCDHNEQQLAYVYFEDERGGLRIPIYAMVARRTDFNSSNATVTKSNSLSEAYIILR